MASKFAIGAVKLPVGLTVFLLILNVAHAQHKMSRGDAAPGLVAQKKILGNPELAGFVQPVQIFTPEGSLVSMWSSQGFGVANDSVLTVGLSIGQVYRVKVSNIRRFFDYQIYPSIELIDRLHPPAGMEHQFPIKIVITQDDLEKAIQGRMVTKVIYLEDADMSLPYRPVSDDQPYFDIGQTEDPLRTAGRMGRPMAIIRMGSRIPTFDDITSGEFDFFSAPVFEFPHPQPLQQEREATDEVEVGHLVPRKPEPNLPPIVAGDNYRPQMKR